METALAILMVLGIFVGIPLVIGFAIVGLFVLTDRRALRAKRAEIPAPIRTEELVPQPIRVHSQR